MDSLIFRRFSTLVGTIVANTGVCRENPEDVSKVSQKCSKVLPTNTSILRVLKERSI